MRTHSLKGSFSFFRCDNGKQLALIGNGQRVKAENLAGTTHFGMYRDSVFIKSNGDLGA